MRQNNFYFIREKLEQRETMYLNVNFILKSSVFNVLFSYHFCLFNFGCGDYVRVCVWQNKPNKRNTGLKFTNKKILYTM